MKLQFWPASMRFLSTLVAGGLAASLVGLSAGASAPPPTLPSHTYSSGLCAWLQHNPDHARGASCPETVTLGAERSGNNSRRPAAAAGPGNQAENPHSSSRARQAGSNVDATNFNEDLASGQAETAIAARGRYVASGWNDATGFLIPDSTNPQGSLTSIGFSANGGASFTDVLLPNDNPCQRIFGDPALVSYKASDGKTYFYVGSLYLPEFNDKCPNGGNMEISMSVGTVSGNSITFDNPIVVANGGNTNNFPANFQGFLDKDWLAIDAVRGKIVADYTCYGVLAPGGPGGPPPPPPPVNACHSGGDVNIALCNIASDPAHPTCNPGVTGPAYMVIAKASPPPNPAPFVTQEQLEGAYDTISATGDLYLAWSQNWQTNLSDGDPYVHQKAARVVQACLKGVPCAAPPTVTIADKVKSLDGVLIPGYNRGIGNDFPRIAFNDKTGRVAIAWNEANAHPLGDIVLVTANRALTSIGPKVRVNDDNSFALHFLPALSVAKDGTMNLSWYDRRKAGGTAFTDVFAASIQPGDEGGGNFRVTTVATEWNDTGSLITPNFGDYTDNTTDGTTFYINWSDGRIGVPNSFVAAVKGDSGDSGDSGG